ncbi:MAG: chaperone modulator CbpM [Candidatus Binataceae bacterium]
MPRRETHRRIRSRAGDNVLISRSAFCTMVGVSERQLAIWEHEELLLPARVAATAGNAQPLYDRRALERARVIRTLEQELEVNLPGIGIILHLLDRLGR